MKPVSILIPYKKSAEGELMIWNQVRESGDELSLLLEFPGGKVEDGESPLEACLREVFEEVGLKLKKQEIKKFKTFSFNKSETKLLIINVFLYEDEHSHFKSGGWLRLSEVNRDEILPNNAIIIDDFRSYYQEVIAENKD